MQHLGNLRLSENGRTATIFVTLDFNLHIYLGESFNESATNYRKEKDSLEIGYGKYFGLRIDFKEDADIAYYKFRWQKPSIQAKTNYIKVFIEIYLVSGKNLTFLLFFLKICHKKILKKIF